jgi:hypothetical protein
MMTSKNRLHAAVLTTLVLGLGCGGGGGAPVTEASFCTRKAEAECQVTERCAADKTMCLTERMTLCSQFATAAKASGKRVFTPGNVNACVDKTRAVYGKPTITPQDMADVAEACNYVFQGDGEVLTDACDVKYDCKGKVICDKGFCAMSMTKGASQPCSDPGAVCATGNYCTENTAGLKVCTAKAMTGAPCSATIPCLEALRCANGTCADRVAAGAACTSNDDCPTTGSPYCDPYAGNRCDPGLSFAALSPSCADYGGTTGVGGSGGGVGGSAGGAGGSGGGAGGSAGGTGGSGGSGGTGGGVAGSGGGAAGTGGGAAGTGGTGGGAAGTGG